ncbi:hypothetical protein [Sphingobacterium sp. SGR-19]|uniref:hypothetical protein n=1 Tax=Sphingobacterium sp. SGR-19 TaxID=2710886 RepID=UPI0013EC255D|nr:hypothetical protein [Sphingobacterium sp. SGR-19]NGM64480.1 hypothetical protein [Sphingobacterium sp. SGR-19]
MKITKLICLLSMVLAFNACKVESENIFTMFDDVKVTFQKDSEYAIVEDAIVNDGDSVHIYFTITSAKEDMMAVVVDSTNGTGTWSQRQIEVRGSDRRTYSGAIKFKMQRDGKMNFRFYALNDNNVFIGDGYTSITVEGAPSYTLFPDRRLYAPVEGEDNPSFLSLTTGKTYSYSDAANVSDQIDFGIDTIADTREGYENNFAYNLYALTVDEYPVPYYDVSGWTKRETKFSAPMSASGSYNTFTRTLVSSSKIEEIAKNQTIDKEQTDGTVSGEGLAAARLIYFRTPEGKYGAMYVNQATRDQQNRYYVSVDIKIQK